VLTVARPLRQAVWVSERVEVLIGSANNEHVRIAVLGREFPDARDYDDGNWLITPIDLRVGRFRGHLPADLRAEELRQFREGLESVYERLEGESVLASLDGWIDLTVRCEANGALTITGVADDRPGIGNKLRFQLEGLDQSYLPTIIGSLREAERAYPVRDPRPGT
jgi:hypothetical protein